MLQRIGRAAYGCIETERQTECRGPILFSVLIVCLFLNTLMHLAETAGSFLKILPGFAWNHKITQPVVLNVGLCDFWTFHHSKSSV